MNVLESFLLSIVLIIDTFTISVSFGLVEKKDTINKHMNWVGIICALGQCFFLSFAYFAGVFLSEFLSEYARYIGFFLLSFLSVYMLNDAIKTKNSNTFEQKTFDFKLLLFLVFATSFDVLSVGLVLGLLRTNISLLLIFVLFVTYLSAFMGGYSGLLIGLKIGVYKGQLLGAFLIFLLALSILLEIGL